MNLAFYKRFMHDISVHYKSNEVALYYIEIVLKYLFSTQSHSH